MTETKSFLPDKRPVHGLLLAHLPYTRKDLEQIAEGANPADFSMNHSPAPNFGLLYLDDNGLGFFVHPAQAPMALLFRGSTNAESSEPVSVHIPYTTIHSIKFVRQERSKTLLKKIAQMLVLRKDEECVVEWNGLADFKLRFFITTDSTEFERKFDELKKSR